MAWTRGSCRDWVVRRPGPISNEPADGREVVCLNGVLRGDFSLPQRTGACPPGVLRRCPREMGASLSLPASRSALTRSHPDTGHGLGAEGAGEGPVLPPFNLTDSGGDEQQGKDEDNLHGARMGLDRTPDSKTLIKTEESSELAKLTVEKARFWP